MMDRLRSVDWVLILIALGITAFHVAGARQVPFHPDETSLLYQSADFEIWLRDPLSLAWDPAASSEHDQQYRALNTPLPKLVLGIGRRLAGFGPEAVAVDWDWSKSWDDNRAAGAIPGEALLFAGRLANIALLPVSLLLVYGIARAIGGRTMGLIAVGLLGTNALVLLHARRAMAEGVLIFGVCLAVFSFLHARDRPWLAGLGAAAAAMAKLSTAALAPVGLALAIWPCSDGRGRLRSAVVRGSTYLAAFAAGVFLLDPFLWRHPFQAAAAMWRARLEFSASQIGQIGAVQPTLILRSPGTRLASLIGNTFLVPPQFAEVGNYLAQTAPQVQAYLAVPGNVILRGMLAGSLVLLVCLLGIGIAVIRFPGVSDTRRVPFAVLLTTTCVQTAALFEAIPVPFQRYYVPLVPFVCLWVAFGVTSVGGLIFPRGQT